MSNAQLQVTLGRQVVELSFVRRHKKMGWSDIRGLFGTTNYELLNSDFGHQVLNFRAPKGIGMGYNYKQYNLCVVWDMFRQDYRVFGAEQVTIKQIWDVSTPEGIEGFKEYFYEYIIGMSQDDKLKFMGYVGDETKAYSPNVTPEVKKNIFQRAADKFKPFVDRIKKYFKRK